MAYNFREKITTGLTKVHGKRNLLGKEEIRKNIYEEIRNIKIPSNWKFVASESSLTIRPEKVSLPSVKITYAPLQIIHDYGKGFDIKSDSFTIKNRLELIPILQSILARYYEEV